MKKFYLMVLSALLLGSCSKETGMDVSDAGENVKFTSGISSSDVEVRTRAEGDLTQFPLLNQGGSQCLVVFMDKVDENGDTTDVGTKATMDTDGNGGLIVRNNLDYYKFPGNGGAINVYSVWPNDSYLFSSTGAKYPSVKISHNIVNSPGSVTMQTGKNKDLSEKDIMLAVSKNVKGNPVRLTYCHIMSNISVAIKAADGSGTDMKQDLSANAIVRVHVPRVKVEVEYPKLKDKEVDFDLSQFDTYEEWDQILNLTYGNDGDYIFEIDTYVTDNFGDYADYARAIVGSMYTVTSDNQKYAYIEILRKSSDGGADPVSVGKVDIPAGTQFLPNKRYIFNITVNKKTENTAATRSNGEPGYSVSSSEMLVQDCCTGEVIG